MCENGGDTPSTACGRSPSLEEGGLGGENRELVECRRARDARTPSTACGRSPSLEEGGLGGGDSGVGRMSAENCNCEMRLQRWVASLQRLDAFATVGCTAVHRRGAHCAPVYLRCYNNLSSGRAKGHRGDRKAPICNRPQNRRFCRARNPHGGSGNCNCELQMQPEAAMQPKVVNATHSCSSSHAVNPIFRTQGL